MTLQGQIDQLTTYRASEWLVALKSGGERERTAFLAWLSESPRHLAEVLSLVALEKAVKDLDLRREFDLQSLLAEAAMPVANLHPYPSPKPMKSPPRGRAQRWAAGIAAGLVTMVLGLLYVRGDLRSGQQFVTAVGEQRSIELLDGSVVYVNAQSDLRVRFGKDARDVDLTNGEALFKVAHDASRPFRVHTRHLVAQAVGTEFNVNENATSTTVSVIEGKVRIAAPSGTTALGASEEVEIAANGKINRRSHVDLARAVAWRQQRIIFDETSLEDVVASFNRYNRSPKLRLEAVTPDTRHYSGDFDAHDPESLAALLAREQDLVIEQRPGEIVIRER